MLRGPLAITGPLGARPKHQAAPRADGLLRAVLATLALSLWPAIAVAQTDAGLYRAASELNIRSGPSITAELIGVIPPDGRVAVSACDAFGWCEVRFGNIDGWAARQFLVRTGDLPADGVPLRAGPPTPEPAEEVGAVVEMAGVVMHGTPCATLRTGDETEYAILGNVPFGPGDALRVLVEVVATDACGGDRALAVLHVRLDR